MNKIIELLLELVFYIFFGLLVFLLLYLIGTTIRTHYILMKVIAWNKKLGLGMRFEFGWLGVRVTPMPGKGTPDQVSTEDAEKPKHKSI